MASELRQKQQQKEEELGRQESAVAALTEQVCCVPSNDCVQRQQLRRRLQQQQQHLKSTGNRPACIQLTPGHQPLQAARAKQVREAALAVEAARAAMEKAEGAVQGHWGRLEALREAACRPAVAG